MICFYEHAMCEIKKMFKKRHLLLYCWNKSIYFCGIENALFYWNNVLFSLSIHRFDSFPICWKHTPKRVVVQTQNAFNAVTKLLSHCLSPSVRSLCHTYTCTYNRTHTITKTCAYEIKSSQSNLCSTSTQQRQESHS